MADFSDRAQRGIWRALAQNVHLSRRWLFLKQNAPQGAIITRTNERPHPFCSAINKAAVKRSQRETKCTAGGIYSLWCATRARALPTRCNYTNTIRARSSALSPLHCAYNSAAPSRNWALSRPPSAFCASCFLAIPRALFYFCVCSLSQGGQIIKSYLSPCCWREHGFYNPVFILFLAPRTTNICIIMLSAQTHNLSTHKSYLRLHSQVHNCLVYIRSSWK